MNVSAQAQGGNAGSVAIRAPNGSFTLNGTLSGTEERMVKGEHSSLMWGRFLRTKPGFVECGT